LYRSFPVTFTTDGAAAEGEAAGAADGNDAAETAASLLVAALTALSDFEHPTSNDERRRNSVFVRVI
jgi:hypothetical protein